MVVNNGIEGDITFYPMFSTNTSYFGQVIDRKLLVWRARILSCSTPKYTELAPALIAAIIDSQEPAGAMISIDDCVILQNSLKIYLK
jgi:hypothetical protein